MLSQHSFNALLKTLEEPPPHVKFIFATTDPHKVLPTVLSRCQRYDLRRIGVGEITAQLRAIVAQEGVALDDGALAVVAREAEGSLRDAHSLLDQVLASGAAKVDESAVRELLGAADRRLVAAVADAVLAGDAGACLRSLAQLCAYGYDAQRFCRDLLEHFRNLAVLRATGDGGLVTDLPEAEAETLRRQAEVRSADDLQRFFRLLLDADETLSAPARTIDPQLVLEMAVLRLATLPPLVPMDQLVARLEALGAHADGASSAPTESRPARSAPSPDGGDESLWERLLAQLRAEKVSLYMALASGKALGVDGGTLRIGVENEAMRRDLTRKDNLERLQAVASGVAGRPLRLEIGPLPSDQAGETPLGRARRRTEDTLTDPAVQAAVEIFGAEVRGVRDRGR
jgi:DNA polymerase III gamma/tau subunit